MNRVNNSTEPVLDEFVVRNRFLTVLGMRGMGMKSRCLMGLLERFREGYAKNQAVMEQLEAQQKQELDEMEQKYFRKDGENMAIEMLMKLKRRYRQPPEIGSYQKLSL